MSHRSLRSTLVPLATGLVAVVVVLGVVAGVGVAGSAPAFGAGSRTGGALAGNPARAQEWWLASLNVTTAWRTTRGAGITVAVLGTGVAASHPDLAGDVVTGPDDTGSGREPGGPYWGVDGTAVAGLIAGHGHGAGRQAGITGVAPGARILSVRVNLEFNDPLNSDQAVTRRLPGAIADGITYAVDHGARVIDLPLDPGTFGLTGHGDPAAAGGSPAERAAVAYALRKSVVLVAPAGDDGEGPGLVNYPAAYAGVITVGAVSRSGHLAPFSSRRSYVSLTAPGTDLTAPVPPDGYAPISSTSTASGIVAGVAALLLARFPHLTVAQVTRALTQSTVRAGGTPAADGAPTDGAGGPGTGYGTVDAARAVDLAARITSAGATRAATPPAKPRQRPRPARRPDATPRRTDDSAIAGSLVRDVVAGLGVLIGLLVVLLLAVSSRRKRDAAAERGQARAQGARGQHEHRRPDRVPGPDQGRAGRAPGPDQETGRTIRPQLVPPSAPAAAGWPVPGGWPGGSADEIGRPPGAPFRPVIAPAPKGVTPLRGSRGAGGAGASGGPPWAPAPEPGDMTDPLPVASASSSTPAPGSGIRVPGDMTAPPAFGVTAQPPPAAFTAPGAVPDRRGPAPMPDFDGRRAATPDFAGPAAIPNFADAATDPDTSRVADGPDVAGTAAGQDVAGTAAGRDRPTRRSLDFAAAPVAAGHPAPASSSVWDLAATDIFPVAPLPAPDDPDDSAPGASGS